MIAGPGGIVERHLCLGPAASQDPSGLDFEGGAKATAVKELQEETGVILDSETISQLRLLPIGEGTYWGEQLHRNYCVVLSSFPEVTGPEKASRHEIVQNGMEGVGRPAGDNGWNAWVDVRELLGRPDLMKGCRVPLLSYLDDAGIECDAALRATPAAAKAAAPVVRTSMPVLRPTPPRHVTTVVPSAMLAARFPGMGLPVPARVPIPKFGTGRAPLGCPPVQKEEPAEKRAKLW